MTILQKKFFTLTLVIILTLTGLCLVENTSAKERQISSIYYGKLYRLKKAKKKFILYVGEKQFYIDKESTVLQKRAKALRNKPVQVIYNQKNYQVINLFKDHRLDPR